MATLAYLNGRFILDGELRLSYADAGFVYGATVTDFCRTYKHKLFRWPDHLARLRRDAATCHIPLLQSDDELTKAAEQLIAVHSKGTAEADDLAVITFATPGPLGYLFGGTMDGPPTLGMHCFPLPKARYRRFFTEGVELQVAGYHGSDEDIVPFTMKHRSRLAWWLAGKTAPAGHVAVLLNGRGMGEDTAIGAIAIVMDGAVRVNRSQWVLESVSLTVLEELCQSIELKFEKAPLPFTSLTWPTMPTEHYAELDRVSEVMLVGSAFGLVGVRSYKNGPQLREFAWPGPVIQKLQAAWSRLVGVDIANQFTSGTP